MTLPDLPYSEQHEAAVLGCVLTGGTYPDYVDNIRPGLFHLPAHRRVDEAMRHLHAEGRPVDLVNVIEAMRAAGTLEKAGGPFFLDGLVEGAPVLPHLSDHLGQLEAYAARRAAVVDGLRLVDLAGRADTSPEALHAARLALADAGTMQVKARVVPVADLVAPPADAEDELLRRRFLCRGGAALLVAQSGVGKSSLTRQLALGWAAGLPVFDIQPTRPLRQLFLQAENDEADEAAFRDGIRASGIRFDLEAERRVSIAFCTDRTGPAFLAHLEALLRAAPVDLLWVDPLLAYLGADVNSQEAVSGFLRNGLQPILARHAVGCVLVHHTPKPIRSSEKAADVGAYLGAGSAELTNYPRAVMTLECTQAAGVFKLRAPKRGGRLGWDMEDGAPADHRLIAHAGNGRIYWRRATGEETELAMASASKIGRKALAAPEDAALALEAAPDGLTYTALCQAIMTRCGCGKGTAKSVVRDALTQGIIGTEAGIYRAKGQKGQKGQQ